MPDPARELTPDELTFVCDPNQFEFATTAELPDLPNIIGQDRAVRAIDFGVEIPSYGFNVYAMGPAGTGKTTTVRRFLDRHAGQEPTPDDWCYVNNFVDPKRPRAIQLPAGYGCQLRDDMAEFMRDLQRAISVAFDSDDYGRRAEAIAREMEEARGEAMRKLEAEAGHMGFAMAQTATGLVIAPIVNGQIVTPEQYEQLAADVRERFESQQPELQRELDHTMREVRTLEKAAKDKMRALDSEIATVIVGGHIDEMEKKYAAVAPEVLEYLKEVRSDVVENVADFRPAAEPEESAQPGNVPAPPPGDPANPLARYLVNVVVDHSQSKGAPIVFESNPTYRNLVGRIEQEARFGVLTTDFTHIRAGSLQRANGGYLVVSARDLLAYPFAWDALKRTIKNQEIRTEMMEEDLPAAVTVILDPEPIPFKAKVILIGDTATYYTLYDLDEDFPKLFKVRADFRSTMDRSPETMRSYAEFVASRVRADGLLPFDRTAVARVIEFGARLVEDKDKLATRFVDVVEAIHEASYWAGQASRQAVTAADVERAIQERRYRAGYVQEQIQKSILEGTIRIQTEGTAVGQVNGLSVLSMAGYEFGIPARISAQTYVGKGNVIAIDREVNLAGDIHNKGMLILQGWLGGRYARQQALSLSASVTFEQSYEPIDGDSASSTELYALLSSLSGLPVRQDLAVTGSVDQQGRVQAIGGATFKIEGFFDLCQARGLSGTQGVLIPATNVRHLILRDDVVQAVREGKFHIYLIETIDQGIELLTGTPAGEADAEGNYLEGTVNYLVQKRLLEMSEEEKKGEGEPRSRARVRRGRASRS
jgi:lon-related putative ATP-dependent protease